MKQDYNTPEIRDVLQNFPGRFVKKLLENEIHSLPTPWYYSSVKIWRLAEEAMGHLPDRLRMRILYGIRPSDYYITVHIWNLDDPWKGSLPYICGRDYAPIWGRIFRWDTGSGCWAYQIDPLSM